MRRAIYPGTFDPITLGHLDVIARAQKMFDEVIVGVSGAHTKQPLFSMEERCRLVENAVAESKLNVRVVPFNTLLVEFVASQEAIAIIRGLRAVADFEFEFQLALMNRKLAPTIETIFLMPRDTYTYLSSSIVKEISRLGGPVGTFVPEAVEQALKEKFKRAN